jgi:hypothetical protein
VSAIAGLATTGSDVDAQKPKDACALLKSTELQALAGNATIGNGTSSTDALGSLSCQYKWGTGGNVQSGAFFLQVALTEIAKAFPGMSPSLVKQRFLAGAKPGKANTAVIPGVGDAALYESDDPIRVKTTALAKGVMLLVNFRHGRAREKGSSHLLLKAVAALFSPRTVASPRSFHHVIAAAHASALSGTIAELMTAPTRLCTKAARGETACWNQESDCAEGQAATSAEGRNPPVRRPGASTVAIEESRISRDSTDSDQCHRHDPSQYERRGDSECEVPCTELHLHLHEMVRANAPEHIACTSTRFSPRPWPRGPQYPDQRHEAHPEYDAAREDQQEIHRADVGSSPLGSDQANNHGGDEDRRATSRRRCHWFPLECVLSGTPPERAKEPVRSGSQPPNPYFDFARLQSTLPLAADFGKTAKTCHNGRATLSRVAAVSQSQCSPLEYLLQQLRHRVQVVDVIRC